MRLCIAIQRINFIPRCILHASVTQQMSPPYVSTFSLHYREDRLHIAIYSDNFGHCQFFSEFWTNDDDMHFSWSNEGLGQANGLNLVCCKCVLCYKNILNE